MIADEKFAGHLGLAVMILLAVYSQLVVKWQVSLAGPLPQGTINLFHYFVSLMLNPWIVSAVSATFFAGLLWMAALTKFELSYAYPYMSIIFVLTMLASSLLFSEPLTSSKVLGTVLITIGIVVIARG